MPELKILLKNTHGEQYLAALSLNHQQQLEVIEQYLTILMCNKITVEQNHNRTKLKKKLILI